jgi:predicted nucleotidyltransferase
MTLPESTEAIEGCMPWRTAEMLASRMVAAGDGEVVRVVFYGSRARGAPRSSTSDWDFIVVLNCAITDVDAEEERLKRAALEGPTPVENIRIDVWPIEKSEWEVARQLNGHAARAADREGVVLYASG